MIFHAQVRTFVTVAENSQSIPPYNTGYCHTTGHQFASSATPLLACNVSWNTRGWAITRPRITKPYRRHIVAPGSHDEALNSQRYFFRWSAVAHSRFYTKATISINWRSHGAPSSQARLECNSAGETVSFPIDAMFIVTTVTSKSDVWGCDWKVSPVNSRHSNAVATQTPFQVYHDSFK